jgi:RNA polymerase sigma factor (sigma-70 family)
MEATASQDGASVLLLRLVPWVSRLARRYEADRDRREDLSQEMMVLVWQALEPAGGPGRGLSYAMDAAREAARAHGKQRRAESRHEHLPVDGLDLRSEESPEDEAIHRDLASRLVDELEPTERKILFLRALGMSLNEIRHASGIPRATVERRLEWALRRLDKARARQARSEHRCLRSRG